MTAAAAKHGSSGGPKPRYFLTGLLTVIPLGVTVFILYYLGKFIGSVGQYPVRWIVKGFTGEDAENVGPVLTWIQANEWVYDILGILLVLVLIHFIGIMTSNFIGRLFIRLFEWFVNGIPLVKTIYGAVKKLVDLVSNDPASGEVQRVVLIEFPSPEMKTVGLVTRTFTDASTGRRLAAVYVPTTPNPTSGYLEIVPVDKIVSTDWTFDQAMSFIVSGGATAPEKMHYEKAPEGAELLSQTGPNELPPEKSGPPDATQSKPEDGSGS